VNPCRAQQGFGGSHVGKSFSTGDTLSPVENDIHGWAQVMFCIVNRQLLRAVPTKGIADAARRDQPNGIMKKFQCDTETLWYFRTIGIACKLIQRSLQTSCVEG
jgi:DUF1680 family protein